MPKTYRALITIQDEVGPDQGLPGHGGGHPDQGLPGGHPGHPDQGLPGSGGSAGQLPVWPDDAPPGTVWPPLPPHFEGDGKKAIVLAAIEGVGYRYIVVEISGETDPDWGVDGGENPDNELPGEGDEGPERPDQGLPGQRPPHPGNRPPGSGAPPRPDQGLPPQGQRPNRPDQGLPGGPPPPHPGNRPPGAPPPPRPGNPIAPGAGPKPGPAGQRR